VRYATIRELRREYPCRLLCRALEVTEQGYYRWLRSNPSREDKFRDMIHLVFADHKRRYGSPRVHQELRALGVRCGRTKVEQIMRESGLRARATRRFRVTTNSKHRYEVTPNTLNREFAVKTANSVWVGDITYLRSRGSGWSYLAVFIDLFSRRVVGWALSKRNDTALALAALERGVVRRRPQAGLLVHTDRGTQFASDEFQARLKSIGARSSMSRTGNCWDNAVAESFFHSLKVEAIYGEVFENDERLHREVFDYIEGYYNKRRRHSFNNGSSPESFEKALLGACGLTNH
jgi:putative transposase